MSVIEARVPTAAESVDPDCGPTPTSGRRLEQLLTGLIVFAPLVATLLVIVGVWGRGVGLRDLVLAVVLYGVVGHGVTIGFHRLLAHRAFRAKRSLKIGLAVAGSMAFEGPVIGWVADHRRHHAFTDRPGDPHSPHGYGPGSLARLRGLWHAHTGWLFAHDPTSPQRYARDLLADRDLVTINRLFPLFCVVSLAVPFAIGWMLGGHIGAGATALLWAGAVRVCVLHHITWSINSICHTFGRRPHATPDRSTNVAALAVISMGESWHNNHHASPAAARHGRGRGQLDSSAWLIGRFERRGWVWKVRGAAADEEALRQTQPAGGGNAGQ